MSSIAQKLCDEIVEPTLHLPSTTTKTTTSTIQLSKPSNSKQNDKPSRSLTVEKKKVLNKVVIKSPKNPEVKQLKSKETIYKKNFENTGINTLITGPLQSDNHCLTMVRKRESCINCKCAQNKRLACKLSSKQIQTPFLRTPLRNDKCCHQQIETVACGTQMLMPVFKKDNEHIAVKSIHSTNMNPGGKRWALSQYPMRGPDF